jgi:transposase
VWVDQSGCDEYYHRDHGRAPSGERIYGEIRGRKYQRTNFIAGYCDGKVLAPFQYAGTTDADLVEGWLETALLPVAPDNAVVLMDNASFHKKNNLLEIVECEESKRTLVFLPKYSPDLNKIETALWANLKNFLRNYMKNFASLAEALLDFFKFK